MASVFISYRRSDCPGHAGRLYDRVVDQEGSDEVFMDIDAIPPGVDFTEYIEKAIGSCSVLLALIGKDWLDSVDRDGRRLDHPDDLVRFEIAAALRRPGVRVIPVLVEDAEMPAAELLPEDLRPLARRNAFELRDEHWRHDVDRLLKEALATGEPPPEIPPRKPPPGRAVIATVAGVVLIAAVAALVFFVIDRPGTTPSEPPNACSDTKDNDLDTMIDFPRDHGCLTAGDRTERGACQDESDNDKDGEIDFPDDQGCSSADDPGEKLAACEDGKDNDGDGAADHPADGACASRDDIAEQS